MGVPLREVRGGVPGGVHQRPDLERRLPDGVFGEAAGDAAEVPERGGGAAEQQDRDAGGEDRERTGVRPELGVVDHHLGLASQHVPEQREVDPRDDHERDHDPLDRCREVRDAVGLRGEPPGRQRGEPVGDGVVEVHVRRHPGQVQRVQERGQEHGEPEVDEPQRAGGFGDPRSQLLEFRAGRFRRHQLGAVDRDFRQDRDHQHDDPHPAEPLGELSPHQQGV